MYRVYRGEEVHPTCLSRGRFPCLPERCGSWAECIDVRDCDWRAAFVFDGDQGAYVGALEFVQPAPAHNSTVVPRPSSSATRRISAAAATSCAALPTDLKSVNSWPIRPSGLAPFTISPNSASM